MNRALQTPPTAPLIIIIQPQGGKQEKACSDLQQDNTYSCIVGKKEGADEIQSHSGVVDRYICHLISFL